jgi:hypothetical protein
MNLVLHLSFHATLGIVAGIIAWLITKRFWASIIPGILAGTLIDLDHVIDYLFTFGWNFNFGHFIQGFQYLESAKMRVMFHGWEYVIILLVAYWLVKARTIRIIFLAVALGLFFHLGEDVLINKIPVKSYSIIYRALNGFEMEKMVNAEHWEEFKIEKANYLLNK